MVTGMRGEILATAVIENYADTFDPSGRAIRRVEVSDALVDPDFLRLGLPGRIVRELGLIQLGTRGERTERGIVQHAAYFPVTMWVQGHDCTAEVVELPDESRVRIGRLPLLMLDLVIDPASGRLIGN